MEADNEIFKDISDPHNPYSAVKATAQTAPPGRLYPKLSSSFRETNEDSLQETPARQFLTETASTRKRRRAATSGAWSVNSSDDPPI